MPPDRILRDFVRSVRRRIALRAGLVGAAWGLAPVVVLAAAGWPHRPVDVIAIGLAAGLIGILVSIIVQRVTTPGASRLIEQRVPASRNLVFTAVELAGRSAGYVHSRIVERAAALVAPLDVGRIVPTGRPLAAFAATLAAWLFLTSRAGAPLVTRDMVRGVMPGAAPAITRVEATVTSPPYARRAPMRVTDPARIEALAGSRIDLRIGARADRMVLETLTAGDTLAGPSAFTATIAADADGFVALRPLGGGVTGERRLIGVTVLPDRAPRVKITSPGKDMIVPNGNRALSVTIEADDDIALGSLSLRYTKVSGSGERFSFADGSVPVGIARRDDTHWTATASWPLAPLALGPGDLVVYRAVATDTRPGSAPVESDAFITEIASPGGEAAPGFSLDPEQDRYAVSQQMVILKTERLLARKSSMPAAEYADEAAQIAIEQRKVRAEFVFMLGGELADAPDAAASMTELNEEAEAAGEEDLLAGRNANAGHVALLRAIRAMSRAAASLTTGDVEPALPQERAALAALESAFSRARILLRALTTRERLDPSRRLTGSLTDAVRDARPAPMASQDARTAALQAVLAQTAALAAGNQRSRVPADSVAVITERLLRIDPSSRALQDVAALVQRATAQSIDSAVTSLGAILRARMPAAPRAGASPENALLRGVIKDAKRGAPR